MKLSRSLMPELSALQVFDAAARHGNFTRAAVELNLTQSAVSRQIRDLETQLGIVLFERVRQRVVLSGAGQRLRGEVAAILRGVEDLTLRAASSRDVTGHLTIATLPTFGSRWLTPRLPRFLELHPGLQATILSRSDCFDLVEAGADLAIHYGKPTWPGATCSYLCAETVVSVAAPFCIAEGPSLRDDIPLLHLTSRPALWSQWLSLNGGDVARGFRGHRFDQFSFLIEAALAGMGAALLPTYLIEREMQVGQLVAIEGRPLATEMAYYIAIPDGQISAPIAQSFASWIATQIGGSGSDRLPEKDGLLLG
ncbi:LysR family transcriptional regulator [Aureimonas sp. AU40]|uniref:LysR family transcriptional regulator n=1 Tax=Aureimonas sp. AU40 TaxID=1637747 RepID=UPI0007860046|nr:LysR family transcriptional regulator [Aureimonas sp. AU40]